MTFDRRIVNIPVGDDHFISKPSMCLKKVAWEIKRFSKFLHMSKAEIEKCGFSFEAGQSVGKAGSWDFTFRVNDSEKGFNHRSLQPCIRPKKGSENVRAEFTLSLISGGVSWYDQDRMRENRKLYGPLVFGGKYAAPGLETFAHRTDKLTVQIDIEIFADDFSTVDKKTGKVLPHLSGILSIRAAELRGWATHDAELVKKEQEKAALAAKSSEEESKPEGDNKTEDVSASEKKVSESVISEKQEPGEKDEKDDGETWNFPAENGPEFEAGNLLLKFPNADGTFSFRKIYKHKFDYPPFESSKFFAAICPEGTETEAEVRDISLTGFNVVLTMDQYSTPREFGKVVVEMLAFIEKYGLSKLWGHCEKHLPSIVDAENATQMYKLAKKYKLKKAEEEIAKYISGNVENVMNLLLGV